jgi:hypothetical protein
MIKLRPKELLLPLNPKDHDMKIMLTQRALKEIRAFGEYTSLSERDQELIPSIGWVLSSVFTDENTGQTTKRGGHFDLGALKPGKLRGWMILEQDGVTFGLSLPKEAEGLGYVEIDYAHRELFISN